MSLKKIWVDKASEFYNRSVKSWLQDNDIEMYSAHNEGKSVVAERFIRTLKNKTYKYMTSLSKNVHIDKLDNIVNKCNNTYHKIKPSDGMLLVILMVEKLLEGFAKKNSNRQMKKNILELKKVIKRRGYKRYVKWKGYDNSYNSWINRKDINM